MGLGPPAEAVAACSHAGVVPRINVKANLKSSVACCRGSAYEMAQVLFHLGFACKTSMPEDCEAPNGRSAQEQVGVQEPVLGASLDASELEIV